MLKNENQNMTHTHTVSKKNERFDCQISKDNILPGCSHIFSNIF